MAAGARQIQGTLNGLGERCGNANLTTLIPTLLLKEPYASRFEIGVSRDALRDLTAPRALLRRHPEPRADAAGPATSAPRPLRTRRGCMPRPFVKPRPMSISTPQLGRARDHPSVKPGGASQTCASVRRAMGLDVPRDHPALPGILDEIKAREDQGYSYDTAQASFELLARRALGEMPRFFEVKRYKVTVERRKNKYDRMVSLSEAVVVVKIGEEKTLSVSESMDEQGHDRGPVNALSKALAKDLGPYQRYIDDIRLVDFKVRITQGGTEAVTRVIIDSEDATGRRWSTVGVSANIVDASFEALIDAIQWKLIRDGAPAS